MVRYLKKKDFDLTLISGEEIRDVNDLALDIPSTVGGCTALPGARFLMYSFLYSA